MIIISKFRSEEDRMPFVQIDIQKGYDKKTVVKIKETIMDSVQETLQIPHDDRNVLITEHDRDFFTMKPPYEVFIEIKMLAGRTYETKKQMYALIVKTLHEKFGIAVENVLIMLNEQPGENLAGRGGIPVSELNLGFKVEI